MGLFGLASLILFGFVYARSAYYVGAQRDNWLRAELAVSLAEPPAMRLARLDQRLASDPGRRRPFGLYDRGSRRIAGNGLAAPPPIPAFDVPFDFAARDEGRLRHYRGLAHAMGGGRLLLLTITIDELDGFMRQLRNTLAAGVALMLLVGLAGACLLGIGTARRIGDVRQAIERIMAGDLAARLPVGRRRGDVEQLSVAVNRMLDELERLVDEVKGVCDTIAHDMRTPLGRLLAGLERARRPAAEAGRLEASVDAAIAETRGILRMFGTLLRISEIEDGMRRSGFARVDLAELAADVVDYYRPTAEARGTALTLSCTGPAAGPIAMRGDPGMLFEAIGNLVENAIKFAPPDGHVRVAIAAGPRISVTDDGPGIPAAERAAVIARFRRGRNGGGRPGHGLGLALVSAIARLHGLALAIGDAAPGCIVTLDGGAARAA